MISAIIRVKTSTRLQWAVLVASVVMLACSMPGCGHTLPIANQKGPQHAQQELIL